MSRMQARQRCLAKEQIKNMHSYFVASHRPSPGFHSGDGDTSTYVSIYTAKMQQTVVKVLQGYTPVSGKDPALAAMPFYTTKDFDTRGGCAAADNGTACVKAFLHLSSNAECTSMNPLCCTLYWVTSTQAPLLPLNSISLGGILMQSRVVKNYFFHNFSTKLMNADLQCRNKVNVNVSAPALRVAVDRDGAWVVANATHTVYSLREVDLSLGNADKTLVNLANTVLDPLINGETGDDSSSSSSGNETQTNSKFLFPDIKFYVPIVVNGCLLLILLIIMCVFVCMNRCRKDELKGEYDGLSQREQQYQEGKMKSGMHFTVHTAAAAPPQHQRYMDSMPTSNMMPQHSKSCRSFDGPPAAAGAASHRPSRSDSISFPNPALPRTAGGSSGGGASANRNSSFRGRPAEMPAQPQPMSRANSSAAPSAQRPSSGHQAPAIAPVVRPPTQQQEQQYPHYQQQQQQRLLGQQDRTPPNGGQYTDNRRQQPTLAAGGRAPSSRQPVANNEGESPKGGVLTRRNSAVSWKLEQLEC